MMPGEQYVCFSQVWNKGAAMASDRFCAGPSSSCFVTPTAGCDPNAMQPPWAMGYQPSGVGTPGPSPTGAIVYDRCLGPNNVPWLAPYTTYLNHPCDLFPSLHACRSYLRDEVLSRLPPLGTRG